MEHSGVNKMPETSIEWTDYSFNPWTGCTKVSDGCKNCYAEPIANRFALGSWGPQGKRQLKGDAYWKQPLAWNRRPPRRGGASASSARAWRTCSRTVRNWKCHASGCGI